MILLREITIHAPISWSCKGVWWGACSFCEDQRREFCEFTWSGDVIVKCVIQNVFFYRSGLKWPQYWRFCHYSSALLHVRLKFCTEIVCLWRVALWAVPMGTTVSCDNRRTDLEGLRSIFSDISSNLPFVSTAGRLLRDASTYHGSRFTKLVELCSDEGRQCSGTVPRIGLRFCTLLYRPSWNTCSIRKTRSSWVNTVNCNCLTQCCTHNWQVVFLSCARSASIASAASPLYRVARPYITATAQWLFERTVHVTCYMYGDK